MPVTATLAAQLRILGGDPDGGDLLAARLTEIGRGIAVAVPSCLTVSIVLPDLGTELVARVATRGAAGPVGASLAVSLPLRPGGSLVIRATDPGAFVLLCYELGDALGLGTGSMELDRHLTLPPVGTNESLSASVLDERTVQRAIGVLLDRGLSPQAARDDLRRRAEAAGSSTGDVARSLLESLVPPAIPR